MKITLAQRHLKVGDVEGNLRIMEKAISEAEGDLVVFGEMALTGYMCRDLFFLLAEDDNGPSIRAMADISSSTGKHILFGMPLKGDVPGIIYNSAVMVSPDGRVQVYDKAHPANFGPFEEGFYFAKGREPVMFECEGHLIGVIVCYDVFHPELVRAYALAGAEAVICISSSPATSRQMFEKVLPARAVEDTVYMLYCNQVGTQLNIPFFGGSQAYGPRGNQIAHAGYFRDGQVTVDIDALELELARRMRPTMRDCGCD